MKSARLLIIVPLLLVAFQLMAAAPVNEAADKPNTVIITTKMSMPHL
jgi:hypothetical protein